MELAFGSIFSVLLLNALILIRAKRLRRLAQARLDIVRAVTEMEGLMMKGVIQRGDAVHDEFFDALLASQYTAGYGVRWKFWHANEKMKAVRKMLLAEIAKQTEVGKLVSRLARAHYRAFENRHPLTSIVFALWVVACAGGLLVFLGGLLGYLGLKTAFRKGAAGFKQVVAVVYTSYEMSEGGAATAYKRC
jgi:hypothetical protein